MRGQTQNLDETTDNLMLALLLASIFVYMVLAAQFESFVQPLVIMTVLPLSIPFALFTILATGRTLNLWSALGILLLFGIVKKNSILQVDYTNVLRARGVPRDEAIVDACRTRLRPILMTTLAIIFGLLPTALGVGIGGAQRSAIAVTIIGAQSLCLFLTLLLVPAAYVKLDALEHSLANQRLSAWLSKARAGTRSQNDHGRSVELDSGPLDRRESDREPRLSTGLASRFELPARVWPSLINATQTRGTDDSFKSGTDPRRVGIQLGPQSG